MPKELTVEEKEDKALKDLDNFVKEHGKALKRIIGYKKELVNVKQSLEKIIKLEEKIDALDLMLRKESERVKQVAKHLGLRIETRRE